VAGRAYVYVDAINLYYGCLRGTRFKWLDLGKLCRFVLPELQVTTIRYFTAIVDSRPDDPSQQQRQQAYLRVGVVNPDRSGRPSALPADFHRKIRPRQLRSCQLPDVVPDERGVVRKPSGW
jgi:hypothetical protein